MSDLSPAAHPVHSASGEARLVLACLGVVYGDIGTSPLYSLRESLVHAHEHHSSWLAVVFPALTRAL